jgi:ribonuclease HI
MACPSQKHMFQGEVAYAWVDGASSGNPGPSGAGVVIKKGGKEIGKWSQYLGKATNNVAEYQGLILALEKALEMGITSIIVHTDSELMHRQMTGRYKVRTPHIAELYGKVQSLKYRFDFFKIVHVPREQNKEADKLARAAREKPRG